MGARTTSRESALQMLFALDAQPSLEVNDLIAAFWLETPGDPEGRAYADAIVRGVALQVDDLDRRIQAASLNWRLPRMARVDRCVLRIGAWELMTQKDVPRPVALDEAVELAKRFGSTDSSSFVNGVLDRVADDLRRRD